MILDYLALAILVSVVTGVFYVFFYIHDIPYELAEKRHHPQKDAIYWGCWLSLCTLHVLWPFIFLWAVSKPGKVEIIGGVTPNDGEGNDVAQLREQVAALQVRLAAVEQRAGKAGAPHD